MIYIYDTLLYTDSTGAVQPWLASKWDRSPDGRTYNFELRDNVRWHDGRPLTPDDVVFSFEYSARQRARAIEIGAPEHVQEVRATGPRSVRVRLDRPVVSFIESVVRLFPIVPKHVWSPIGEAASARDLKLLVGTGPYKLESYSSTHGSYVYIANDDFFLGRPFIKRIELRPVDDELVALRAGQIDVAGAGLTGATAETLKPFRKSSDYGVIEGPPNGLVFALYWNLAKGGALGDVRFRQACARAIDREEMVRRLAKEGGSPGNPGFLPPGHPFRAEVEQYPFSPAEANRLLDEAGFRRTGAGTRTGPDGRPLRFELMTTIFLAPVVEVVMAMLAEVGIELKARPVDPPTMFTNQGNYEMAMLLYAGQSGDPDYMRALFSSKVDRNEDPPFHHVRGWADAEFDQLAERQLVTLDEAERKKIVARMQEIVARDLPQLHLYYPNPIVIFRKKVFDQVAYTGNLNSDPLSKQAFVTGVGTGGLEIRPMKD